MIWLAREGIFVGAEGMSTVQTPSLSRTGTLQSWMLQVIDRLIFFRAHKVKFSMRSMATPSTLQVPRRCTHVSDKVWCGKLYPSDPAQSLSLLHDEKDLSIYAVLTANEKLYFYWCIKGPHYGCSVKQGHHSVQSSFASAPRVQVLAAVFFSER